MRAGEQRRIRAAPAGAIASFFSLRPASRSFPSVFHQFPAVSSNFQQFSVFRQMQRGAPPRCCAPPPSAPRHVQGPKYAPAPPSNGPAVKGLRAPQGVPPPVAPRRLGNCAKLDQRLEGVANPWDESPAYDPCLRLCLLHHQAGMPVATSVFLREKVPLSFPHPRSPAGGGWVVVGL